jgi:uncharacterized membrane protein YgdD (TMEM256/DUF423 family)
MTPSRLILAAAGLCGALGVALSAIAAHRADMPNLGTAANMLMFHAPAFLALAATSANRARSLATSALLVGLVLFVADLLARSFLGTRLFPMAAPTGGVLMIAGWLGIAASALARNGRSQRT